MKVKRSREDGGGKAEKDRARSLELDLSLREREKSAATNASAYTLPHGHARVVSLDSSLSPSAAAPAAPQLRPAG